MSRVPSVAAANRQRPPRRGAESAAVPAPTPWHHVAAEEALLLLGVNLAAGLDEAEVRRRRQEFGPNQVTARPATPAWRRFLRQFHQPLVYLRVAGGTLAEARTAVVNVIVLVEVAYLFSCRSLAAFAVVETKKWRRARAGAA